MTTLRTEFEKMQIDTELERQEAEHKSFREASKIITKKRNQMWNQDRTSLMARLQFEDADLAHTHRVQRAQLEQEMRALPNPIIKLTRQLLDMKDSEKNLVRQKRFEEAKQLRKRVDKQGRKENDIFEAQLAAAEERRRKLLQNDHAIDRRKRMQMSKKMEWGQIRSRERDMMVPTITAFFSTFSSADYNLVFVVNQSAFDTQQKRHGSFPYGRYHILIFAFQLLSHHLWPRWIGKRNPSLA
jgi:hypothetical protein